MEIYHQEVVPLDKKLKRLDREPDHDKGRNKAEDRELPDPLAYDSAFRTMLNRRPALILPVLNVLFDEHFRGDEHVTLLGSSNVIRKPGLRDEKRYPDGVMKVDGNPKTEQEDAAPNAIAPDSPDDNFFLPVFRVSGGGDAIRVGETHLRQFHIECESNPNDKTMSVRIFEYGYIAAMDGKVQQGNHLIVTFPRSAVLFLRSNRETPDEFVIEIVTPGGSVSYAVPTLKMADYTVEMLFEQGLLFLVPFFIFNCERELARGDTDETVRANLLDRYRDILRQLDLLHDAGKVDTYGWYLLRDMIWRVGAKLLQGHDALQKGLKGIMSGYVVETWPDMIIRKAEERGMEKGMEKTLFALVQSGVVTSEYAAHFAGMAPAAFTTKMRDAGYTVP